MHVYFLLLAALLGSSVLQRPLSEKDLTQLSDDIVVGTLDEAEAFHGDGRSYFIGTIHVRQSVYGRIHAGDRVPLIWSLGWSWCFMDWSKIKGKERVWFLNKAEVEPRPGSNISIGARSLYDRVPPQWRARAVSQGLFAVNSWWGALPIERLDVIRGALAKFPVRLIDVGPVRYPIVRIVYRNPTAETIEYPAIYCEEENVRLGTGAKLELMERVEGTEKSVAARPNLGQLGRPATFRLLPGDEQLVDVDLAACFALRPGHTYTVRFAARSDLDAVELWVPYPDGVNIHSWYEGFGQ